jgi:hypothetical protein
MTRYGMDYARGLGQRIRGRGDRLRSVGQRMAGRGYDRGG